jgi:hypothetical protein
LSCKGLCCAVSIGTHGANGRRGDGLPEVVETSTTIVLAASAVEAVDEVGNAMELATNPAAGRAKPVRTDHRSAVTNGKRLHVVRPGDTAWARRFRDVLSEILSDLGHDGLSEGQRQLARRAATISIMCERMEGEAAAGANIDLDVYGTLTDRLGRAFQRLGLERRARTVEEQSLAEIIAEDSNADD